MAARRTLATGSYTAVSTIELTSVTASSLAARLHGGAAAEAADDEASAGTKSEEEGA